MKKLFKDFIVFIFLTSFFFSILLFLNGEKFIYKDLKLIFDVDADASPRLLSIKKTYRKKEKEYYLYNLFLLLIIFLLSIIIILLFLLKRDCEKYEICSCEADNSKLKIIDFDNQVDNFKLKENNNKIIDLDNQVDNFKLKENNNKIIDLDNQINAFQYQMKGRKKSFKKAEIKDINQDYKYDIANDIKYEGDKKFRVVNFDLKHSQNRSLFPKKDLSFIKKKIVKLYEIKKEDEEEFFNLYDKELKLINTAKNTKEFENIAAKNTFVANYKKKEDLMFRNEQIDEALFQEAKKLKGYVNDQRRQNENEMLKEKIAFRKKEEKEIIQKLDESKEVEIFDKTKGYYKGKLEKYKKTIIEIILEIMVKDGSFARTRNVGSNFEIFCSKYYKHGNKKREKILSNFQIDGKKMEKEDAENMYDEFYFLIQKGIYFPLHEIAKFHNLSSKVLTKTTGENIKKFINPEANIKYSYETVAKAINKLQKEIYRAVELNKREKKGFKVKKEAMSFNIEGAEKLDESEIKKKGRRRSKDFKKRLSLINEE